jgi:hypothetical protein
VFVRASLQLDGHRYVSRPPPGLQTRHSMTSLSAWVVSQTTCQQLDMDADDNMHIKAVGADLTLGGEIFTARLVQHCLDELPAATGAR